MYDNLITAHFYYAAWSVLVIVLFVFAAAFAAIYTPLKRIREMEVTGTINEL